MLFIIIQFSSHIRIYTYCVKESPLSLTPRKTKKPQRMQYRGKAIDFSENKCWIPPGFRGRSIPFKILSALLYSMLFYGTLFMELEDTSGKTETMLSRVLSFILFFSIVLFSGNWGGFWGYLPLLNSGDRTKRLWVLSSIYLFLWQ